MEEEIVSQRGRIRKITVGTNPKDGKAIVADRIFNIDGHDSKVVDIIKDTNFFKQTGKEKFLIIMLNDKKIKYVWGEITDMPTWVEYGDPQSEPIRTH